MMSVSSYVQGPRKLSESQKDKTHLDPHLLPFLALSPSLPLEVAT